MAREIMTAQEALQAHTARMMQTLHRQGIALALIAVVVLVGMVSRAL